MNVVGWETLKKIGELLGGSWRYNFGLKFCQLRPRSLMINLTYKCNSRCVMCSIWQIKPENEVSLSKWREVMKDNIFAGIRNLTISGGNRCCIRIMYRQLNCLLTQCQN